MSRVKWEPLTGSATERKCPHCKALPRSSCKTPSGKVLRKPHAKRYMAEIILSRFATTRAGTGHVRDGEVGSRALCGTAVILEASPDNTHVSCSECRSTLAYLADHPDESLNLRVLPLSA